MNTLYKLQSTTQTLVILITLIYKSVYSATVFAFHLSDLIFLIRILRSSAGLGFLSNLLATISPAPRTMVGTYSVLRKYVWVAQTIIKRSSTVTQVVCYPAHPNVLIRSKGFKNGRLSEINGSVTRLYMNT